MVVSGFPSGCMRCAAVVSAKGVFRSQCGSHHVVPLPAGFTLAGNELSREKREVKALLQGRAFGVQSCEPNRRDLLLHELHSVAVGVSGKEPSVETKLCLSQGDPAGGDQLNTGLSELLLQPRSGIVRPAIRLAVKSSQIASL